MAWHKPSNIREWLGIVIRHRKKAFFPAIIVMIGVLVSGVTWPKEYYAEAKLRRENDLIASNTGGAVLRDQIVQMRAQIYEDLRGREAVEKVARTLQLPEQLRLPYNPDTQELTREGQLQFNDLVAKLRGQISIGIQFQTDQADDYVISYNGVDRELAPRIVNQLVENYIRDTATKLANRLNAATSFFDEQAQAMNVRKDNLERDKMNFEQEHQNFNFASPDGVQKMLDSLREHKRDLEEKRDYLRADRDALKKDLEKQPEMVHSTTTKVNPELEAYQSQLRALEQEIANRRAARMLPTHPTMIELARRVEGVKATIAKLPAESTSNSEDVPNVMRDEDERRIKLAEEGIKACEAQISKIQTDIDQATLTDQNFFQLRNKYQQLDRDVSEARDDVVYWRDQYRRVKAASEVENKSKGTRLLPLQRANDPGRPSSPRLVSILGISLAAAMAVAAAMILLAELMDRSFHTAEQAVDELKLPVLGAINEIVTPALALRRRVLGLAVVPACCGVLLVVLIVSILVVNLNLVKPQQYDELVTQPKTYLKQVLQGTI